MKKINLVHLITLITILSSLTAFAGALDRPTRAKALKENMAPIVLRMTGVNGIGVSGCEPATGALSEGSGDFVHCVAIYAETEAAQDALEALYPVGTKINGVYVATLLLGEIIIQPRISLGN